MFRSTEPTRFTSTSERQRIYRYLFRFRQGEPLFLSLVRTTST